MSWRPLQALPGSALVMRPPLQAAAPPLGPPAAHRPDIEGLRGLAVLSVFAVHSVPHALRGGFIGVDVFFVISGYLIASITLKEAGQGRFSVAAFYARRVRRLAPALLLVLGSCAAFAAWWAFPRDAMEIGRHVAGGAAFISNLLLWREGGYFDQAAERKLLLHLWSLGIEEQFYLLWPLAVLVLARARQHALAWVLVALVASFLLNVTFVGSKPKGTFFLPLTRFWELLAGVALACWEQNRRADAGAAAAWPARLADLAALASVLLIGAALYFIDKTDRFPGWWALLPTVGTVLLIAAGPQAWVNRVLLANPVLGFYGSISYPLYLWHWPVLTAPLLMGWRPDLAQQIGLLCLAVLLATATCFLVERPIRHGAGGRRVVPLLYAGLLLVGALGLWLWRSEGRLASYPAEWRAIADLDVHSDYASYRIERCFLRSEQAATAFAAECVEPVPAQRPLRLLWGDSHAAALYPGLQAQGGPWRLAQFTAAACPPGWPAAVRDNPGCGELNAAVLERIARLRPAQVVLAANWMPVAAEGQPAAAEVLRAAVASLRAQGVGDIRVVGPLPRWLQPPPRVLLAARQHGPPAADHDSEAVDTRAPTFDRELQALTESLGARYASPQQALCGRNGCLLSVREGAARQATAFDESHLTAAGSRELVRRLAEGFR